MEVVIKDCADNSYVIEVGVDDTTETMRQKVASAVGLAEDSFHMGFGGKEEGDDITQLSAGDTIILTESKKFVARAALHALGERDITAERLVTVEDPEVACLLLQAEVATVIPNQFLAQTSLTALDLSAVSCVTEMGDKFLHQCTSLTSIDLSGLTRLTRIGTHFLANCSSLTAVDLALSNVTHIHSNFLFNCSSLTAVDLSPLRNVTQLGHHFLAYCSSLTAVDLSPLSNVTHIGTSFLYSCTSLTAVDLSPLRNVAQIDDWFLIHCKSIKVVDLSSLSNVTQIGRGFLYNCIRLTELDLSSLSRVTHFGDLPADGYTSLRSIHLGGCSSAVSSRVRVGELKKYVVDAPPPPTRGRDEKKAELPRCSVS